ncbi:DUF3301 domain-containing protein [Teredinibacter purpureus]|uniref:DUF3301 domain-containing protein n=1 Tax=Teredinibacter purpureus TaxID=2731756 RepID=UPI0005F7E629|nr:DUF3301 domain-containing protein [Teredinibacter purpureus]
MTLSDLTLLSFLFVAGIGIWQHLGISQRAYTVVKRRTEKAGVTLLDQSIVLRSMRLCRSSHSLFAIERRYNFEFSSVGDVRYPGNAVFAGKRLLGLELAPFKEQEPED